MKLNVSIDRGGTFTDVYGQVMDGDRVQAVLQEKLLSVSPEYREASAVGIKRLLNRAFNVTITGQIPGKLVGEVRLGTTIATNALLEGRGQPVALLVTAGFRDVLYIGDQTRPNLFQLAIPEPHLLYSSVHEVDERVVLESDGSVRIEKEIDLDTTKRLLRDIYHSGTRAIAISFIHALRDASHEQHVESLAREIGFTTVIAGHKLGPIDRYTWRTSTAVIEAYLSRQVHDYLSTFMGEFDADGPDSVYVMQSDGTLVPWNRVTACRLMLSGPAGGVIGCHASTVEGNFVGLDMGGTSTDVSTVIAGRPPELTFEGRTPDGQLLGVPGLGMETVAAGGGSVCSVCVGGIMRVGPESAGSDPGPACYGRGGPLTITDANLVTGRLVARHMPSVFGADGQQPVNKDVAMQALKAIHRDHISSDMSEMELAVGFLRLADEAMSRPIRLLTEGRGFPADSFTLVGFGGAAGQHVCGVARALGIRRVRVPLLASVLSAFGISCAEIVQDMSVYLYCPLDHLNRENVPIADEYHLKMRFDGLESVCVVVSKDLDMARLEETFLERFRGQFGFVHLDRKIIVDSIICRNIESRRGGKETIRSALPDCNPSPTHHQGVWFEDGYHEAVPIYEWTGDGQAQLCGPCIICIPHTSVLVEPGWRVSLDGRDVILEGDSMARLHQSTPPSIMYTALLGHRFMSIAEQMGAALRLSAVSVNIKERLDFSCAVFDRNGDLIANAPHIPVHLGAMSMTVKYCIEVASTLGEYRPGDAFISNHPMAGGSHLPDITIMTPVFHHGECVFWVASRGHHADVGGVEPGSVPANSSRLYEEGVRIMCEKLVSEGHFDRASVEEWFVREPATWPNCRGVQNLDQSIADLSAQIAANQRGVALLQQLLAEYSLEFLVGIIKETRLLTAKYVTEQLSRIEDTHAKDFMDDGTLIALQIKHEANSVIFDFTASGDQVRGNWNAPPAVVQSAVIYALRVLVDGVEGSTALPLNQGFLDAIQIVTRPGSILDPGRECVVVGGNVLTSQRIVDVCLRALCLAAASQGCMNNVTFGTTKMMYYETTGGGSGAGPGFPGRSCCQCHMTNTRCTDVETLESHYPVILRQFTRRHHSGGAGKFSGGDGIIRHLEFRERMRLNVLTERRTHRPFGMEGGKEGACGKNTLIRGDGWGEDLGGKAGVWVDRGDMFCMETPGGGGWGKKE